MRNADGLYLRILLVKVVRRQAQVHPVQVHHRVHHRVYQVVLLLAVLYQVVQVLQVAVALLQAVSAQAVPQQLTD